MPKTPRRKGPARLALIAGSGLITLGFLGAVAQGPRPAAATPPGATIQVRGDDDDDRDGRRAIQALYPARGAQIQAPRVRTRGS
ncbi:MAG TPA: hypothetical protein VFW96_02590 [Thermomicrobiales bacterium]|nr:hypothetical protein [Thermomicrobiales bacterium]